MTDEQLRAHGLLNGQTLLVEWRRLYTSEDAYRWNQHMGKDNEWLRAVTAAFGDKVGAYWLPSGCRLSNGEHYFYVDES